MMNLPGRVARLQDVFIRPPPEGKRMSGEIEIHSNGLRYKHPRANQNIGTLKLKKHDIYL